MFRRFAFVGFVASVLFAGCSPSPGDPGFAGYWVKNGKGIIKCGKIEKADDKFVFKYKDYVAFFNTVHDRTDLIVFDKTKNTWVINDGLGLSSAVFLENPNKLIAGESAEDQFDRADESGFEACKAKIETELNRPPVRF